MELAKMRKIKFFIVLFVIAILVIAPAAAFADTGPKPSVVIDFEGLEQKNCYVTLLSKSESTGPHSVYDGTLGQARYHENDEDFEIWKKFVSYKDKGGFYFLQYFGKLDNGHEFKWGYYPPEKFKILMYFPEDNSFAVSDETYERYAFDSYYKVDAKNLNKRPVANGTIISAVKAYNYNGEFISLIARIIITIMVELLIALMFGFRTKKQIAVIGITNVITQTVLNILLNIINFKQGQIMFILNYFWLEILVIAIEAAIYYPALNKYGGKPLVPRWTPILYAITANAFSFVAGLGIAYLLPGIF
jgi:hypothetical protein